MMMSLATKIEIATNGNDHTGAAIMMANAMENRFGDACKVILEEIEATSELNGYILDNHMILRDSLIKEMIENLRIRNKL